VKINVNKIQFAIGSIVLEGDFASKEHQIDEDTISCWCKPSIIYINPIDGAKLILHREKFEH